jgi:hypothetical protein
MYDVPKLRVSRELPVEYPCFVRFSSSERQIAFGSWKKSFVVPSDQLDDFESSRRKVVVK